MMIAIIIAVALASLVLMARKPRRRRRWTANMQNVNLFHVQALGTVQSSTLVTTAMLAAGDNEYRLLSLNGYWSIRGATAGEGPIICGVAHSDYSIAEIEEFLENETQLTRGDVIATREIGKRLVRRIGQFSVIGTDEVLNDGLPVKVRLNWPMSEDSVPAIWAYNFSGAQLTTGAVVSFTGKMTIAWK